MRRIRTMSNTTVDFQGFPKMARLSREIVVTEKLDGTNAQVCITDDGEVLAGSRTRWITPTDDNFGFAAWVAEHADELRALGPGRHFGEWWGQGIRRKYNIGERRFSLFNVSRWADERPACCHVVPTLYRGDFDTRHIEAVLEELRRYGSQAAPGFMQPEGIVVFDTAGNVGFNKTLEKDTVPKTANLGHAALLKENVELRQALLDLQTQLRFPNGLVAVSSSTRHLSGLPGLSPEEADEAEYVRLSWKYGTYV